MPSPIGWLRSVAIRLGSAGLGIVAALRLIGLAVAAAFDGRHDGGTARSRLLATLAKPASLRLAFDFLRAFAPTLTVQRRFVRAFENSGTALVTRFPDVEEVLLRDQDFEVVYGPRMRAVTGGADFFLGMADSPDYTRDVTAMRLVARRDDLAVQILPFVARTASELVSVQSGRIDVPQHLTLPLPARLFGLYFGTPGPSEEQMIGWTTLIFWYLFADLGADAALDQRALTAAAELRAYLDEAIAVRKAKPHPQDDVLARCLTLQAAAVPGMHDIQIRNNLLGLLVGAIPTLSKAAVQALDVLLDRPSALASACNAARSDDDALLTQFVFEALRFNPVNPLIYRRAARDTQIAANSLRTLNVRAGTLVLAANLSAMFDPLQVDAPRTFRTDRPARDYLFFGDGLHTCFGQHINRCVLPAMLKPLLRLPGLRRSAGPEGRINDLGTPFPAHLWLEYDAAAQRPSA